MTLSSTILLVQYGLVVYIAYYLMTKPLDYLHNINTRNILGNLYSQLDASSRNKVIYGLVFYLQRCFVILVIVLKIDSGVQWPLLNLTFLMSSVYLFAAKPYSQDADSIPDKINSLLLLLTSNFQASMLSAWINDGSVRF